MQKAVVTCGPPQLPNRIEPSDICDLSTTVGPAGEPVLSADVFASAGHAGPLHAVEIVAVVLVALGLAEPRHAAVQRGEHGGRLALGERIGAVGTVGLAGMVLVEDQEHAGQPGGGHVGRGAAGVSPAAVGRLAASRKCLDIFSPELVARLEAGAGGGPDAQHAVLSARVVPVGGLHVVAPALAVAQGGQQPLEIGLQQGAEAVVVRDLAEGVFPDVGPDAADIGVVGLQLGEPVEGLAQLVVGRRIGPGGEHGQRSQARRAALPAAVKQHIFDRAVGGLAVAEVNDGVVDGRADLGGRDRLDEPGVNGLAADDRPGRLQIHAAGDHPLVLREGPARGGEGNDQQHREGEWIFHG